MLSALSKAAARMYGSRERDSAPSYGIRIYGKTPCTCKHAFWPVERVREICDLGLNPS